MSRDDSYTARLHLSVSRLTTLGWPVFEARENKAPATKRGFKDARIDSDQVPRWRPNAMAAHATGRTGRTVVFDFDVDTEKNLNAIEWLVQMEARCGELPPHPIALTPRGGEHHYFEYPDERTVKCSAGKIARGVDVRGDGGYVIVPDSESNKGTYRWKVAPWDVSPPVMPPWLLELVADHTANGPADIHAEPTTADKEEIVREFEHLLSQLKAAKDGSRNHTLNSVAFQVGRIVETGALDAEATEQRLLQAAQSIGLTLAEAKATVRSGMTAGRKRPWRPLASHRELQSLNRDHFFSTEGKTAFIFREDRDPIAGTRILSRYYPSTFREQYGNRFVPRLMPDGSVKQAKLGETWLSWSDRRQYDRVTFLPGRELPSTIYNQWQGFSVEGAKGDCSNFLAFMRDVLCGSNENYFRYLEGWCCRAVQYPWKPGEVAVVLRGSKGTGKSFFAKHIGELFGDHFVEMTSARHLTGNFNAHLETAVLVFADEAFWAGDKQGESTLKALITSDTMLLERKGIDARMTPNYTHLIVASNSDWTVPATPDERRFFVLDVSTACRNDHEYFQKLAVSWQSGEREAFLHHLQTLDISQFNVRKYPQTEALLDQKLMSLGVVDRWYFAALNNGHFESETWKDWISSRALHESLVSWCKLVHARVPTVEAMGMRLAALVPISSGSRTARTQRSESRIRNWGYEFGTIERCREHFERIMGAKIEWATEGEVKDAPKLDSGQF